MTVYIQYIQVLYSNFRMLLFFVENENLIVLLYMTRKYLISKNKYFTEIDPSFCGLSVNLFCKTYDVRVK